MKLLIIEDEEMMRTILSKGLRKSGYAVDEAGDGEEALYLHALNEYDLIILDLNLPKIDGMEVLKAIRSKDEDVKIIILSARSQIENRIEGLDAGSNDYMVKPFDFHELEARIRNLLRRSFVQKQSLLTLGRLSLDTALKQVTIDHNLVELTKKEYSILEYLMMNQNIVISAEQLIEHVWDSEADLFSNSLKFHISSLKKKLAKESVELIQNLRGQGYVIRSLPNI